MQFLLSTYEQTPATISSGTRRTIGGQATNMVRFGNDLPVCNWMPIELVVSGIFDIRDRASWCCEDGTPEARE